MDVFKYIISIRSDKNGIYRKIQEPFINTITLYTKNGCVQNVLISAKPERMKKAALVGICQERKVIPIINGPLLKNPSDDINIQNDEFMLIYNLQNKELKVFKI